MIVTAREHLALYADPRGRYVRVPWHLGHWPGHLRLVTPWRVLGVIWR